MIETLKLLGLTNNEIKIYLSLLEKGKLKASQIVSVTNVASSKIYELLDSLHKKGIIQLIPEKVNYYVANSFEHIEDLINNKQKELEKLKIKLREIKELSNKRIDNGIILVKGKKNFHRILKELKGQRAQKTFGYTIKWAADITNMNVMKSVKENIKKGIEHKVLYDYSVPKKNIEIWEKIAPGYKFIKSDGVAIDISDDSVLISIVELDSTILIKSKAFSEVMKQLFEGYYNSKE